MVMHRLLSLLARALCALPLLGWGTPAAAQRPLAPNGGAAAPSSTPARVPPLTLGMLLIAVRDGHPTIQSALARVRAAEGMRATAGRLGNPVLSYQSENTTFLAGSVVGIDRETMEMATLPLEPIYLRGSRVARASAEVRAARADAERERQHVGLDAAGMFYRVALARITSETDHDLVAWLDSLVAYNRIRAREGVAAEADLLRASLERDRAAAEATMSDAELAQASAQLAAALGAPATSGPVAVIAGESPLVLVDRADARVADGSGLASAVALRSDVRAARERETAAAAGISTERRMLFREAGATLGIKQMMGTNSMIAGLSLPFPLFDQNRGEVARATAERDIARFDLAVQERLATADVAGSLAAARLLTAQAEALARPGADGLLARADEMRRIALGAYREGAIPLIQVLDAAQAWGATRLTYYRTLYAQHQAVLALIVATGGDLFTAPLTPTSGSSR